MRKGRPVVLCARRPSGERTCGPLRRVCDGFTLCSGKQPASEPCVTQMLQQLVEEAEVYNTIDEERIRGPQKISPRNSQKPAGRQQAGSRAGLEQAKGQPADT